MCVANEANRRHSDESFVYWPSVESSTIDIDTDKKKKNERRGDDDYDYFTSINKSVSNDEV